MDKQLPPEFLLKDPKTWEGIPELEGPIPLYVPLPVCSPHPKTIGIPAFLRKQHGDKTPWSETIGTIALLLVAVVALVFLAPLVLLLWAADKFIKPSRSLVERLDRGIAACLPGSTPLATSCPDARVRCSSMLIVEPESTERNEWVSKRGTPTGGV